MSFSPEQLRNLDFEKLYHFYLVFREGSIKKVVDNHHISSSILRHSLITIETKLDIKLYRTSKKVFIPTEEAKKLYPVCREIIETLNDFHYNIKNESNVEQKRDFIIITTTTIANYYLPAVLKNFFQIYPDVQIKVFAGHEYLSNIYNHAFDMIISPKINNTDLASNKIGLFKYKFYCSKSVKQKLSNIKSPEELENQDLLLFSGVHFLSDNIIKRNKVKAISNSFPFLLHLCSQGQGILSCFNTKVFDSLNLKLDVKEIFPDYVTEEENAFVYYNRRTDKLEMIKDLTTLIRDYLDKLGA